jgi:hypothetical protein
MENRIQTRDLNGFNKLIQEMLQGGPKRTGFQPWEVQLLIDLSTCRLSRRYRTAMLLRYQETVQRLLLRGESAFLPPSEFLFRQRGYQHPPVATPAELTPAQ